MGERKRLCDLVCGERAKVQSLQTETAMRRRFLDIGLTENATVECVGKSPCGDPSAYLIRGAVIAIRSEDAATVFIEEEKKYGAH